MSGAPTDGTPLRVGRYAIFGALAAGGMATVHFGRLEGEGGFSRIVAVKRLRSQFVDDPDFSNMLRDEARIACRIRHPNVVPVLDVVAREGELLLVMEYVDGVALGTLVGAMRDVGEPIAPAVAVAIVTSLLRGLHAAHEVVNADGVSLGIVHRDVSEQNVLIGVDGISRVIDFGIAKAVGRSTVTREGQLKGKLRYMAPEQIRSGDVDRRSDVYAAAVVLWQLLTGERLFDGDEATVLYQVLERPVEAPSAIRPHVPPELDGLVMRGLERDAALRFPTAGQMADALVALFPPASPDEVGRLVQRHMARDLEAKRLRVARIEHEERIVETDLPSSTSGTSRSNGWGWALVVAAGLAAAAGGWWALQEDTTEAHLDGVVTVPVASVAPVTGSTPAPEPSAPSATATVTAPPERPPRRRPVPPTPTPTSKGRDLGF